MRPFWRLALFASVDWMLISAGIFGAVLASGANIGFQVMFGDIVKSIFLEPESLDEKIRVQIACAVGIFVGNFLQMGCVEAAGMRLVARVQRFTFAAVMEHDMAFFDKNRTGELTAVLNANTALIRSGMTTQMALAFKGMAQFTGILVYLIVSNGSLTAFFMGTASVPLIVAGGSMLWISSLTKKMTASQGVQGGIAQEYISGIRTVCSFSMQDNAKERYVVATDTTQNVGIKLSWVQGSTFAMVIGGFYTTLALAMWKQGHDMENEPVEKRDAGALVAFINLAIALVIGIGNVMGSLPEVAKAVGASKRIFEIMDRPALVNYRGGSILANVEGHVEFEDVTFEYPTRPDKVVLDKFNLNIRAGQQVALVGASGSGKSTVLSLVERFYDPSKTGGGTVLLDGHDVSSLDPMWMRKQIGFVMQEPVLFAGTIRDNIRYGNPNASDSMVEDSAKKANAHDFIVKLPEGYDTVVGERGVSLSGGQKQRVAIARALVKDPKILLLDEATSALDAESEFLVQQALDRLMMGRTTIVVAHRLSTIQKADLINVFDNGRIVEAGTHEELIRRGGVYSELVSKQTKARG